MGLRDQSFFDGQSFNRHLATSVKGKWHHILSKMGLSEQTLSGRHGPCPMCGGKDRFRWDNLNGRGTWICNRCGAGDGFSLIMNMSGSGFRDAAKQIEALLGSYQIARSPEPLKFSDEGRRKLLRNTYAATRAIENGDLADIYLASRDVGELKYPEALRFAPRLRDGEGGIRPCLIAVVSGPDAVAVSLHRTFLKSDGSAKADMVSPRKLMPGRIPSGSCVRLGDHLPKAPLGIAEGIETALAASALYDLPVWAALNAGLLDKWVPPPDCPEVTIFADNDQNFTGQAKAYALAHRLSKTTEVNVKVPDKLGDDYNNVLLRRSFGAAI